MSINPDCAKGTLVWLFVSEAGLVACTRRRLVVEDIVVDLEDHIVIVAIDTNCSNICV